MEYIWYIINELGVNSASQRGRVTCVWRRSRRPGCRPIGWRAREPTTPWPTPCGVSATWCCETASRSATPAPPSPPPPSCFLLLLLLLLFTVVYRASAPTVTQKRVTLTKSFSCCLFRTVFVCVDLLCWCLCELWRCPFCLIGSVLLHRSGAFIVMTVVRWNVKVCTC